MSFIINTPTIAVQVVNKYLTQDASDYDFTSGYLTAVKSVDGNCLMFTVMLDNGAMYSNLPIEVIYCARYGEINPEVTFTTAQLQPYSCLDGDIEIVEYGVARHSEMMVKIAGLDIAARYLFTIDYNGTDLADDPEQRKTHNIVCLVSGQLAALPNNKCLFMNKSLTKIDGWPKLRRTNKYYTTES
jgi:hypothetical protein